MTPKDVRSIRTKLGLSQRDASVLLGGGEKSFYRYEAGKSPIPLTLINLLTLLDKDPQRLVEIYASRDRFLNQPLPKEANQ